MPAAAWLVLEHECAGAPRAGDMLGGELDRGCDLFGLTEIIMRAFAETRAFERYDALIAFGIRPLIDGEGEMSGAEQAGN